MDMVGSGGLWWALVCSGVLWWALVGSCELWWALVGLYASPLARASPKAGGGNLHRLASVAQPGASSNFFRRCRYQSSVSSRSAPSRGAMGSARPQSSSGDGKGCGLEESQGAESATRGLLVLMPQRCHVLQASTKQSGTPKTRRKGNDFSKPLSSSPFQQPGQLVGQAPGKGRKGGGKGQGQPKGPFGPRNEVEALKLQVAQLQKQMQQGQKSGPTAGGGVGGSSAGTGAATAWAPPGGTGSPAAGSGNGSSSAAGPGHNEEAEAVQTEQQELNRLRQTLASLKEKKRTSEEVELLPETGQAGRRKTARSQGHKRGSQTS